MGINIRRRYNYTDSPEATIDKFKASLNNLSNPFIMQISDNLVILKIKQDHYHWWSPEMNLRFENEDNSTVVYEVIGPNPSIFTQALFFALLGSVTFIFALIIAFSQITLGMSPIVALAVTILSASLVAVAFIILGIGRIKAKEQVEGLENFVKKILDS